MLRTLLVGVFLLVLAGCSVTPPPPPPVSQPSLPVPHVKVGEPYSIEGITYRPVPTARGYDAVGVASWYGSQFHGKPTANGEIFDMHAMTAAHKTLPLPSIAQVTNLSNGRRVIVRINDRGPFVGDRLIDMSYEAARRLGFAVQGTTKVRIQALSGEPKLQHEPQDMQVPTEAAHPATREVKAPIVQRNEEPPISVAENRRRTQALPTRQVLVQVGAFSNQGNAHRVVKRIDHLGAARIEPVPNQQPPLYRVRLGPLNADGSLDELLKKLVALGFPSSRLIDP
ncbi:rare lipoprotein A [Magnetococcus marinus MC-1]|uniref:Endolytic peptidoglycan transglycosylase RlpA n=1 Tax=Magnetococcus marinus (strain ATCC BAA-1437 / JCM 17883 / MC-1) TaxID=156889 RepID=A0L7N6_MAGMM|nr:septal ring lytic transglycosylase RlpA family protein [Magnetococcus marinus]ABK43979.1 rare lipoprotein A [Magnetococcus marinus MC-1]